MSIIKTDRLTIRHIVADDWKSIKEIWVDFNTSALSQYDKPHITDDADVQPRIAKWAAANSGTEHMFFAICLGYTVIGYSAFNIRENGHEIGYCFHSAYHGKGYAKESHLALIDYMRDLGIKRLTAGTALNNTPSVSLLKSLGFELSKQKRYPSTRIPMATILCLMAAFLSWCCKRRTNISQINMTEDFMKINDIETPRLLLRGFTKEDALWAYSIWNDPEMGQYLPDEAKEEIDDEYLQMLEGLGEDDECCYLIPVFKDSLERVGTCSFMISEDKKVYDIAYCVHKNFWCQGYATEIAQGMIEYARSQGAEKVTIFVGQENAASNRVAQKCGGKIVGENTYQKRGTDIIMKDFKYEVIL